MTFIQESVPIDILSISHYINYVILWIYVKNNYILAFVLGIIWEIFEYYITNYEYTKNLLIKYWFIPQKYWEEKNKYNRVFDIIFNMIGYTIGNLYINKNWFTIIYYI